METMTRRETTLLKGVAILMMLFLHLFNTDFKIGLKVPGKLQPKRIKGGIVLKDTTYEMR